MHSHTSLKQLPATALLFILCAPITIGYYSLYVFNPVHAGNIYLYVLQVIADVIAIVTISTLWLTILLDMIQPEYHKRNLRPDVEWFSRTKPTVDVLIPVANEPVELIEENIKSVVEMEYDHKTYILDDGNSPFVKQLALKYGIHYLARNDDMNKYAKSGNLNFGLEHSRGEFFVVFDADYKCKKEFLITLLPFFHNEKIALVQTPQFYINTHNFIASGTSQAQEIFYKYVQPAKNSYNASFCVGTSMIYRRSAIDAIGGIALRDHSEDIWTTIHLHENGYESLFYSKVLAKGKAPERIDSYFRQQNRWARGGFSLFFHHNPLFAKGLTVDQRLQYFFSNIHYFTGFSIFIYLILPIVYLLFGLHPIDIIHNSDWIYHYVPYFLTIYFLPLFLLGNIRLSTIATSIASFYPYIKAFFSVVVKNQYKWISTESSSTKFKLIMTDIWPHVFLIVLSFFALIICWYKPFDTTTTFITSFWVIINAYFLFIFVKKGLFG